MLARLTDPATPRHVDLQGKVALVTGAGRGLGRAIAEALASAGCDVVVSDQAGAADSALAYAAVYLCRAENVTGTTLTVAGGGEVH